MASRCKRAEFKIRDSYAADFFHGMSCLKKLVAQSILPRFGKPDDIPRRFLTFNALNVRSRCAPQRFDFGEGEQRLHLDVVRLLQAMRSQELIGKVAVVREEH